MNKWLIAIKIVIVFIMSVNLLLLLPAIRAMLLHFDDFVSFSLLKSLIISPVGFFQDLLLIPYNLFFYFVIADITLCAFMLAMNNLARIIFIFSQGIVIVFGGTIMLIFFLINRQHALYWIFDTFLRICLFPLGYCVFFLLPQVTAQFKIKKQLKLSTVLPS